MIRAGETIEREDGERLVFRKTPLETDGELLEVEVTYRPNSPAPPSHYHPSQEEHFRVLSGTIQASIGGVDRTFGPGEEFDVPPGSHHWMHNVSDEPARVNWQVRPPLRTMEFLHATWSLSDQERNLFTLAAILRSYPREFRLSRPPFIVQRALFAMLAPLGRLLGKMPG